MVVIFVKLLSESTQYANTSECYPLYKERVRRQICKVNRDIGGWGQSQYNGKQFGDHDEDKNRARTTKIRQKRLDILVGGGHILKSPMDRANDKVILFKTIYYYRLT